MLRMPEFRYAHPKSAEEAVDLMFSTENAHYVAGGTDLLPNIKHPERSGEVMYLATGAHEAHGRTTPPQVRR